MFKQCSYFMLHDWAGLYYVTFLGTQLSFHLLWPDLDIICVLCPQMTSVVRLLTNICKTAPPENIAIYRLSSFLKHWLLFSRQPQSQRANCNLTWADNKIVLDATDTLKVLVISWDLYPSQGTHLSMLVLIKDLPWLRNTHLLVVSNEKKEAS